MTDRPAAFLDRDGVLNRRPAEHQYVRTDAELEVLPDAAQAVSELARAGFAPIVVSNQRGVARGLVTEKALADIELALRNAGIAVEAFYYCKHDIDAACSCRKPQPGLLIRAAAEYGLSLADSVVIGDSESDVEAGVAAGCYTVLISKLGIETAADAVATDLLRAAQLIIDRWPVRGTD